MSEIAIYSTVMFWAGVFLTRCVFYFHQTSKEKRFCLLLSATILQVLNSVYSSHLAAAEYAQVQLKKIDSTEETDLEEYLEKEKGKIAVFMEIYTLLLIKAVPEYGRKYVTYNTWPEALALIEQMRGITSNGKIKG